MSLLSSLNGWSLSRRLVLPVPGEELTVELHAEELPAEQRLWHARLKSVGFRRLLLDDIRSWADGPEIRPAVSSKASAVASFARESAMYNFETVVETTKAAGTGEPLLSISRPRRVERVQRRGSYRVTVETRTNYRFVHSQDGRPPELLSGQIVNLSEGGVLLSSTSPIKPGAQIVVRVPSGRDGTPMDVAAVSIDTRSVATARSSGFLSRLRFDNQVGLHLTET